MIHLQSLDIMVFDLCTLRLPGISNMIRRSLPQRIRSSRFYDLASFCSFFIVGILSLDAIVFSSFQCGERFIMVFCVSGSGGWRQRIYLDLDPAVQESWHFRNSLWLPRKFLILLSLPWLVSGDCHQFLLLYRLFLTVHIFQIWLMECTSGSIARLIAQ